MKFEEDLNEYFGKKSDSYRFIMAIKDKYCIDKAQIKNIIDNEIKIIGCKCNLSDCPFCHEIRILNNIKNKLELN
jgi:hypothetical protein